MHGRFIGEVAGVVVGVHGVAVRRMVEKARGDGERDLWIVKWKGDEVFGIDTTYSCNYTRFINHSCKPNLRAILVFQRSKVKSPPRIAFFALHTIKADSELTVDYGDVDVPGFEYTGMCKCNVIGKEGGKVTCKRAPVRNGKRKWVEEIEDDVQVGKKKGKGLTKKK
ncbi:SET domain-containing protein [Rhizoclosmatium globosum]|uniref:SET domain-containing protein n=1 Tax=Rhizoclosmatium globosum TaxID=329046 RepID=A0A1Y2BWB4_9FUNG|nr:SET domain-containing protein [Rhizoclosmatium globosum]|eukprot:ORY39050.1 SET domain-containing protein [Rhizoclosmatium globosum]